MKLSNRWTCLAGLLTLALCAAGCATKPAAQQNPPVAQRDFASPEEAVKALQSVAEAKDVTAALTEIFGAQYRDLQTGDAVQDADNQKRFAAQLAKCCNLVKEGEDKITLEVGENCFPMPIPLVKADGRWHFDTAAGEEEIINRRIGRDELSAIAVCRAYVAAQKQCAAANATAGGEAKYALKFKSSPGAKDGLYWPAAEGEPPSPFGPLAAQAHVEGFGKSMGSGTKPFHGYFFRILTCQGKDAPGGEMDYMSGGDLTAGFALVAYPAHWDVSGIMTFIVNQDGKVYQCNLGEKTYRIAKAMPCYNPGTQWTLVKDEGVSGAALEK